MTSQRRIVIAPDSFKGTATAPEVVDALAAGLGDGVEIIRMPMADGGEGTLDAIAQTVQGARRTPVKVTGPAVFPVDAEWVWLPPADDAPQGTGVIELASTSGIELLSGELRPWQASTLGFGQAIAKALDHGVSRLVLGIGSSASTDGGVGMLTALGARFTDEFDMAVAPGAEGLSDIRKVDLSRLRALPDAGVQVLTDVTNPLLGASGAAAVFGAQKGLTDPAPVDAALANLVERMRAAQGEAASVAQEADPDEPGAGAAGGAGYGLLAWGADLTNGAERVAELIGLREAIVGADLVITGEGSFDGQSAAGKVPSHVAASAREAGVPVALVAGRIADDADTSAFAGAASLTDLAGSSDAAMADPARWLTEAARALVS
ncbi:glycerate kinase [Microbacterium sp. JB110]|uniref:glycerate kinase n=1 Tax=Microbacterium sp. JB110 TaxID=2024477 RepID=UPI00097ECD0D|nr:glycerate kinase [Microbacterium sp. JB110]RCS57834.1 glycerate kinase [Microbacterium sp. JB110]SJM57029.1 Glycerate kinase [Frigoribacterium sp. JB110]